jgi:hypothetical protein
MIIIYKKSNKEIIGIYSQIYTENQKQFEYIFSNNIQKQYPEMSSGDFSYIPVNEENELYNKILYDSYKVKILEDNSLKIINKPILSVKKDVVKINESLIINVKIDEHDKDEKFTIYYTDEKTIKQASGYFENKEVNIQIVFRTIGNQKIYGLRSKNILNITVVE